MGLNVTTKNGRPRRWVFVPLAALVVIVALLPLLRGDADIAAENLHPMLLAAEPLEREALAWYREGLEALGRGDLPAAERGLRRAAEREPQAVAAHAALGHALGLAGRFGEARELLEHALHRAAALPRSERLRLEALAAELDDRRDEASERLQSLLAFSPGDRDAGFRLFALQLDLGQNDAAARSLAQLSELSARPARDPRLPLAQARLAGRLGDRDGQLEHATAVIDGDAGAALALEAGLMAASAEFALGRFDAAAARSRRVAESALQAGRPTLAIRAGLIGAAVERERSELDAAEALYQQLIEQASAQAHWSLRGEASRELAILERMRGRASAALARLDEVIDSDRGRGDRRSLAASLAARGTLLQQMGRLDEARGDLLQALAHFEHLGDRQGEGGARSNLGMVLAALGRQTEAEAQFERALAGFERLGDRRGQAMAQSNLAALAGRAGRTAQALERNEAALEHYRALGTAAEVARLQFNLGLIDRRAGALTAAVARFTEAVDAFAAAGAEDFRRHAVAALAELKLRQAELDQAEALLAAERGADGGDPLRRAVLLSADARLQALRGKLESAESLLDASQRLREDSGSRSWVDAGRLERAGLDLLGQRLEASETGARELVREFARHGEARAQVQALLLQAEAMLGSNRREAIYELLGEAERMLRDVPERELELQLELLHALLDEDPSPRLGLVRHSAAEAGFELLALRAALSLAAAGTDRAAAQSLQEQLQRRGLLAWAERIPERRLKP
jgi:tetratricopeptide (TPR) repeat protein